MQQVSGRVTKPVRAAIIAAAILLLCGLAAVAGRHLYAFSGNVLLELGTPESLVVRERAPGATADTLPLDNPAATRFLSAGAAYQYRRLPFTLCLNEATTLETFAPGWALRMETPTAETQEIPIEDGSRVKLGAQTFLARLVPWGGLVNAHQGEPMAALREGGALHLLSDRQWRQIGEVLVHFRWCPSERDAASLANADALLRGRWGVREGARVHWFDGFVPGSGVTLENGAEYTLVSAPGGTQPAQRTLTVLRDSATGSELLSIPTNGAADKDEDEIVVVDPGAARQVLILLAWRDGHYLRGVRGGDAQLDWAAGSAPEPLKFDKGSLLQIEQALQRATPAATSDNPVVALELEGEGAVWVAREGIRMPHPSGTALTLLRRTRPPRMRYAITANTTPPMQFALETGNSARIGRWTFAATEGGSPRSLIVSARRSFW